MYEQTSVFVEFCPFLAFLLCNG